MPLVEAAELVGISYRLVWERVVKQGWDTEEALNTPARSYSQSIKISRRRFIAK